MKGKAAENWMKLIRFYTFNSPVRRGKYRLFQFALRQIEEMPEIQKIVSRDGRVFSAEMKTGMFDMVYFLGEYEKYVTDVIQTVVMEGDICLDVGANFGWFTTLLIHREKKSDATVKEIHSFEPIPSVFENLSENVRLAGSPSNVFLNNFALTDEVSESKIYIFDNLASGHASLSNLASDSYVETTIKTSTLNKYIEEKQIPEINFIKIDIEGSELDFLKGAGKIFEQKIPPVMMIEMALGTTKNFGYLPDDIIKFIKSNAEYDFYALDEANFNVKKIEGFSEEDIGANVLCMPKNADGVRMDGLKIVG